MASEQLTQVYLLNVPLDKSYQHTLYFESETNQRLYFLSKREAEASNLSYQRKDSFIRFPRHIDEILHCNYVMYRNPINNSDKWIYAFITNMVYINDEVTEIYIETDVLQTFLFDYNVKTSFIEREHVTSDLRGEHLFDEGLQLGEYVCNFHNKAMWGDSTFYIVVGLSKIKVSANNSWGFAEESWTQAPGGIYSGLFSGLCYKVFDYSYEGFVELQKLVQFYDEEGHGEDIQLMFLCPKRLINVTNTPPYWTPPDPEDEVTYPGNYGEWVEFSPYEHTHGINKTVDSQTTTYTTITLNLNALDGYIPRNNKLFTHPFCYLLVANNNGIAIPYQFEYFKGYGDGATQPAFQIEGSLCPGCSVRMIPWNYKGTERNSEEGINLGKFPVLNWTSDAYTNWMTQNSVNVGIDLATNFALAAIGIVGAAATGGSSTLLTGVIAGTSLVQGVSGISKTMGEVHKASFAPAQSKGNTNAGDIIAITGDNDFHFYTMSINKEHAAIIDGFFDMFGYKVNAVKIPNKNHRENYWYTKTIDVTITGRIPQEYLQKIKQCYNNGITFWKNPDNLGNYSVSNSITV